MTKIITFALLPLFFCFCKNQSEAPQTPRTTETSSVLAEAKPKKWQPEPSGSAIMNRFPPPEKFNRTSVKPNSFAAYLRNLPLKPDGTSVHLFDGTEKWNQNVHAAVIDLDVGKRDLQQCADAVMRLRAEHLFAQKNYSEIHFNFVSGFRADYATWRKGNRIKVTGNKVKWQPTSSESESYASFRKYMTMVFSYAGTLSLAKEMKSIRLEEMQIGDVFIQGGSPGHAVIVVDMAVDSASGKKCFLLAQSYMPAQDIHVLKNPSGGIWYPLNFDGELVTPEWTFSKNDLKRFE